MVLGIPNHNAWCWDQFQVFLMQIRCPNCPSSYSPVLLWILRSNMPRNSLEKRLVKDKFIRIPYISSVCYRDRTSSASFKICKESIFEIHSEDSVDWSERSSFPHAWAEGNLTGVLRTAHQNYSPKWFLLCTEPDIVMSINPFSKCWTPGNQSRNLCNYIGKFVISERDRK